MENTDKQKLIEQINSELQAKNFTMKKLNEERGNVAQYIMHGTHMSPEEFEKVATASSTLPAFNKHTQNELDVIKQYLGALEREDFGKIDIHKRVFGIEPKKDKNGNTSLNENGQPVPHDGSFAYSLKKCSAAICFSEDGAPILIGLESKYSDYESGSKNGYIYCLDGKNFSPEFDKDGNITEWTSLKDEAILHVTVTTPDMAMSHNVQFVMFKSEADLETAMKRDRNSPFENTLSENSVLAKQLREAIVSGRATYINASPRGHNPKIKSFEEAQRSYDEKQQQIAENMAKVKSKMEKRNHPPKEHQPQASNSTLEQSQIVKMAFDKKLSKTN